MNHRVLTVEQIREARRLKATQGLSKRKIAKHFEKQGVEVGGTTIWEALNPGIKRQRAPRTQYFKVYFRKVRAKVCIPCKHCEICMTKTFEDQRIPLNYQIGDTCVSCYMEKLGLRYIDLLEV